MTATAIGSLMLSFILHRTDSYAGLLVLGGVVTLLGVGCFYLMGHFGSTAAAEPPVATPQSA